MDKTVKSVIEKVKKLKLNHRFKFGLLAIMISLISCDGYTGMEGIVKDSETGKELEGVNVEMTSYYKTINTITNASGEFYTFHTYSCGITKCTDKFTIKFEKDGYEIIELKESYRDEKIVIELVKIEKE